MTNVTRLSSPMSVSGFPRDGDEVGEAPAWTEPMRSDAPIKIRAAARGR
jgi:hypothetical protein